MLGMGAFGAMAGHVEFIGLVHIWSYGGLLVALHLPIQ
jgi:hypothetical protein